MLQIQQVIWGVDKMFKIIKDNEEIVIKDEIVKVLEYKAPFPLMQQIKDWIDSNYYQKVMSLAEQHADINPNKITYEEKERIVFELTQIEDT